MRATSIVLVTLVSLGSAGCASATDSKQSKAKQADYHYKLGNTYYFDRKIASALQELTICLSMDPDHPDAHHLLGFIFMGRKEYASAERHFRKALRLRGAYHAARANLGAVLLATKRWKEALEVLEPLVGATLYATPWLVHNNIGYAWEQLGKPQTALKHYRMAVFHNPKFCLGFNNLGRVYKKMGQADLAMDHFARAIKRCKRYAEPHFHLGEIYAGQGQAREAHQAFAECYKLAPETDFGRLCRRRL